MQSRPIEASQSSSISPTSEIYPSSNHGLSDNDEQAPRLLSTGEERGEPRIPTSEEDAVLASDASQSNAGTTALRRLKSSKTRSPAERIDEYEKASTPSSRRKNAGPSFKVVQKGSSQGGRTTSSIAEFPNG